MKLFPALWSAILGLCLLVPPVSARGERGEHGGRSGGGRSGGGSAQRSAQRSPMTGSKVQRPKPQPAPKPASRPQSKPAPRPEARPQPKPVSRPAPQRPSAQKPAARPDGGNARPGGGGNDRPNRPDNARPDRPGGGNVRPPDRGPGQGPDKGRPSVDRPDKNKPSTLPGMVTYPNRPDTKPARPGGGGAGTDNRPNRPDGPNDNRPNRPDGPNDNRPDRPGGGGAGTDNRPNRPDGPNTDNRPNRPDGPNGNRPNDNRPDRDRPSIVDRDRVDRNQVNIDRSRDRNRQNNVHIDNVNVGRRNVGLNRPGNYPDNRRRDWDGNRWGGNNSVWGNNVRIGNNVNVNINNNFRNNNNFACRPNYWGSRPWWGTGNYHSWHHGHWGYGWNSRYYSNRWYYHDDDFARGFMWGITAWSLGSLVYDMGYQSYSNPYPAPPVQNTYITYAEPVSRAAAANPPGDEQVVAAAETKSDDALDESRSAFKAGDYVSALTSADEAIKNSPGDVTLHEYRALVFFALGKYGDAAGVLNPVLASGPGWSWDTMIGFYGDSSSYNDQLRKLEAYAKASPDKADAQFLLGYHYMVCGYMDKANARFTRAATLQPADSISRQLRDLTADSISNGDDAADEKPAPPPPPPVASEKLVGNWTSDNGAGGKVSFKMGEDGDFSWNFTGGAKDSELKGTYGINDKGLLVLTTEDTQMVSTVELKDDGKMHFTLVGAPDGDPGLDFTKG